MASAGRGQEGMTIALVLFFLVVAALLASLSFRRVKGDMDGTTRNVKVAKSRYAAEAAVYLGLSIVEGTPGFTCVTHESDGKSPAAGPGSCGEADLTKVPSLYSTGMSLEPSGWLETAPADTVEALSGTLQERLRIKIWTPSADTVRVVGRAVVNGIEQDVQLFGNW